MSKGGKLSNNHEDGFNDLDDVDHDEQFMASVLAKRNEEKWTNKAEKLENQHFDLAVPVNDNEEIESEDDDDKILSMISAKIKQKAQNT